MAPSWLEREGSQPVPTVGPAPSPSPAESPPLDGERLLQSFGSDVRDLRPILESILTPETLSALNAAAQLPPAELRYPDELWVATVYQFLAAHQAGVMRREHITQALLPLYLGRAGAFMLEHAGAPPRRWTRPSTSSPGSSSAPNPYLVQRWARTQPR